MQEYSHPNGSRAVDVLRGNTVEELRANMEENRKKRNSQGYNFIGERMLTPNSKCTCGSGKKIKRCCRFLS